MFKSHLCFLSYEYPLLILLLCYRSFLIDYSEFYTTSFFLFIFQGFFPFETSVLKLQREKERELIYFLKYWARFDDIINYKYDSFVTCVHVDIGIMYIYKRLSLVKNFIAAKKEDYSFLSILIHNSRK